MKKIPLLFLVLLLAHFSPAAAQDQNNDEKAEKNEDISLEPIVVTPSRYAESTLDVSKSVSVITESEIDQSSARYVPGLFKDLMGVNVRNLIGNPKTAQVDIRGFGDTYVSNVLVLVNGRRTNQIDLSGVDWAQIDKDSIERIEIVRGPQTVLYGDNATGGVINIITKTGEGARSQIGAKYELGTYNYQLARGFAECGSDFLDYYVSFASSFLDGYRHNSDLETDDFNANFTLKPDDWLHLNFSGNYHKDWYGLPGGIEFKDINRIGRRGSTEPDNCAKTEDYYMMFSPEITGEGELGELKLTCDMLHRARRVNSLAWFPGGASWETTNHIKSFGVTPKLALTVELFDIKNRMILGLDYYTHKDEILDGMPGVPGANKDMIVIEKQSCGLYLTDTVNIYDRFILNGGFRAEWADYKFDQQFVASAVNRKAPFEWGCEVGVDMRYNKTSALYANYARSFRFPAVDEWYTSIWEIPFLNLAGGGLNLDLVPQTANNFEIGVKDNTFKPLNLDANWYLMYTKHEIYFNPDPAVWVNSIYDRTMRYGFEAEGRVSLFEDALKAFANYTFESAYFVESHYAGNVIPMVPRHKFSAGLNYTFADCVNINYAANYVGKQRYINDVRKNITKLSAYLVQDLKLSYAKHGFEVYGVVYNLFDESYCEYGATNWGGTAQEVYPAPGRNFALGVSYKF